MSSRLPENKTQYDARTDIGQHFLINEKTLTNMGRQVPKGKVVVEIGAGLGQLTRIIAANTSRLVAVEIDPRFETKLNEIRIDYPQVEVLIGNILRVDLNAYDNPWLVGNIPYHITEPLIAKLARSKIAGASLLVGKSFAEEATAIEKDMSKFGKLSMIVDAFFRVNWIETVGKENFDPRPRTTSAIINLEPREETEYEKDRLRFLIKMMFLTTNRSPLVKNVLRESLIRFNQHIMTKNEARSIISEWGIPEEVLSKPFEQLNNEEYRLLYERISKQKMS